MDWFGSPFDSVSDEESLNKTSSSGHSAGATQILLIDELVYHRGVLSERFTQIFLSVSSSLIFFSCGSLLGTSFIDSDFPISSQSLVVSNSGTVLNDYANLTASVTAGATVLQVSTGSAFSPGERILVIQIQNTLGAGVGTFEFATISSVSCSSITLTAGLGSNYFSGPCNSNSAVVAQVVSVPEYSSVHINVGASVTASAWDGCKGGVVAFRSDDSVMIDGSIQADGLGFRGGLGGIAHGGVGGQSSQGVSGESIAGLGVGSALINIGGGGGATATNWGPGGGGGGHQSVGLSGGIPTLFFGGGSSVGVGGLINGGAVHTLTLGSGGGGGAGYGYSGCGDCYSGHDGGSGGSGGGLVLVQAHSISITGSVTALGSVGLPATDAYAGGGGGGSGGSIYFDAPMLSLGSSLVQASGASGGAVGSDISPGGSGGDGFVFVAPTVTGATMTGTTVPTAVLF